MIAIKGPPRQCMAQVAHPCAQSGSPGQNIIILLLNFSMIGVKHSRLVNSGAQRWRVLRGGVQWRRDCSQS